MDKKLLITILLVIITIIGISGCTTVTNNTTTVKNYTINGFSFNYPSNWHVSIPPNKENNTVVIISNDSHSTEAQVQITVKPNNGFSEENVLNESINSTQISGGTKISNDTITIDNKTAYESSYLVNDVFVHQARINQIYLVENDTTYMFMLQASTSSFDSKKPIFNMILNSFKVNNN